MTLRKQKFTPSLFQVQNGLNKNHSWPGNDLCRSDFPAACFWLKCLTSHWTVSLVSMSFCLPSLLWFIVLIYLVLPGFPSLTLRIPGNEMYSSWHADAQPCGRCYGRFSFRFKILDFLSLILQFPGHKKKSAVQVAGRQSGYTRSKFTWKE